MHHVLDKAEVCLKKGQLQPTNFLDPYTVKVAFDILKGIQEVAFLSWGGYQEAERKKIGIYPADLRFDKKEFSIALISFQGNFKFFENNHRHVLGALLASGIKRDKFGDIFIGDNQVQVIVDSKTTSYVVANVVSIGPIPVVGEEKKIEDLLLPKSLFKEIRATVISMRLDAVLSAGFFVARGKSAELIKKEKVKVNWQHITRIDYQIEEGDILSVQGKGRIKVLEVLGTTRKDRIALKIGIYV
ncbi:MAG: hypothetical protein APF76_05375 [Desulfitibacter sp. BRH_c19]|nr:MAG: hypothetical protein APF76_05375 [Desulfitibacter sp. BRH_c19]